MDSKSHFEPDVVHEIFKKVWARSSEGGERSPKEETEDTVMLEAETVVEVGANGAAGPSKRPRSTTANGNALKLTCELLRLFVSGDAWSLWTVQLCFLNLWRAVNGPETVHRTAMVAEAEGSSQIEGCHLERILPQLLLDF